MIDRNQNDSGAKLPTPRGVIAVDSDFQVSQLLSPSHSIIQVWSVGKKCKEDGLCAWFPFFLLISVDYELHKQKLKYLLSGMLVADQQ